MQIYSFRSLNCMHLLKKWVIHQVIPVNNRSIMLFDTLSETCTAPEKASIMIETGLQGMDSPSQKHHRRNIAFTSGRSFLMSYTWTPCNLCSKIRMVVSPARRRPQREHRSRQFGLRYAPRPRCFHSNSIKPEVRQAWWKRPITFYGALASYLMLALMLLSNNCSPRKPLIFKVIFQKYMFNIFCPYYDNYNY